MSLLGHAAIATWSNTSEPEPWAVWHSREHLPERVDVPGFLRGRRMRTEEKGAVPFFILYELADASVLHSPAYLQRLNHPTEWTNRIMPSNLHMCRTLCTVAAQSGEGVGGFAIPIPLNAAAGRTDELQDWLRTSLMPTLASVPTLTGCHLLLRHGPATHGETQEERLRGKRNLSVDGVLTLEGYDAGALVNAVRSHVAEGWRRRGGASEAATTVYQLAHVLAATDRRPPQALTPAAVSSSTR